MRYRARGGRSNLGSRAFSPPERHPPFPLPREGKGTEGVGASRQSRETPRAANLFNRSFAEFTPPKSNGGECEQKPSALPSAARSARGMNAARSSDRRACPSPGRDPASGEELPARGLGGLHRRETSPLQLFPRSVADVQRRLREGLPMSTATVHAGDSGLDRVSESLGPSERNMPLAPTKAAVSLNPLKLGNSSRKRRRRGCRRMVRTRRRCS